MKHYLFLLLLGVAAYLKLSARPAAPSAYLFAYFTGNDKTEEAIHFALSPDGYHYTALNGNRPVVGSAAISRSGGVRDPHILRGADGRTFFMVATDMVSAQGWNANRGLVLLKSTDLVHWTSRAIHFPDRYPGQQDLHRVWAPQTIYDPQAKKYLVYFSLQYGSEPDKIYCAYANTDFTDLEGEPRQLYVSPTNGAAIDGDIVAQDGQYYLFFKTEGQGNGIKVAVSDRLTSGYVLRDHYVQQTTDPVEGAGTFKLIDSGDYILMYDVYTKGRYQFTRTRDLEHFAVVDQEVTMNFHPRHGTVLPLTAAEAERLAARWLRPADVLLAARRPLGAQADSAAGTVTFAVAPTTNLRAFDPGFDQLAGVRVAPAGPQDFSRGPVRYTVAVGSQRRTFAVRATPGPLPTGNGH